MPGNVASASASVVLPSSLSTAFQRSKTWEFISNFYCDGRHERRAMVQSERNTWVLHKRLTAAQMSALRTFYSQQQGSAVPFYFYDPYDSAFVYDGTGARTQGRYIVRFQGDLVVTGSMPRVETDLTLMQIA